MFNLLEQIPMIRNEKCKHSVAILVISVIYVQRKEEAFFWVFYKRAKLQQQLCCKP